MDTEKKVYIAKSADVIGDVHLEDKVSVWYQAVLRAEEAPIRIGAGTLVTGGKEIPDGHMAFGNPMKIRREVTEEEIQGNRASALHYQKAAEKGL